MLFVAASMLSGCADAAYAQEAKPAAPAAAKKPEVTVPLSSTETMAIRALAEKIQANRQKHASLMASVPSSVAQEIETNQNERDALVATVKAIEAEIVAEHPGYHFDEAKGNIVKDDAPAAADMKKAGAARAEAKK